MNADRLFLNVARSMTGRAWRDRLDPIGLMRAQAIAQRHELPDLLARVLAGRGVEPDDVPAYLDPALRHLLPDPSTITDMDKAASRLADAIIAREPIAVFGDYDVDGACASAILLRYLRACGHDAALHIPDRIFEGYGPNIPAIQSLAGEGARLLVTVDCGTTSGEALAEARRLGLATLVIDHHQAGETLPPAHAIVNPNRQDDLSGLGHLCAAGLVFVTLVAVNRALRQRGYFTARPEPDLLHLLDLVALATVTDVVPLKGLNRAFVSKGLVALRARSNPGLRALMDVARLDGPPMPWHLGFMIGPRINAGGRIGRAWLGARLLSSDDAAEVVEIAAELDRLNQERQVIEQAAVAEAEQEAATALGRDERGACVVVAGRWHPGVVGLVAARLKERFGRPAFAVALDAQGGGTGSGRSIAGVDLGRAVRRAVEVGLLPKGGGHAMAAGVTLAPDTLALFRAHMETMLAAEVEAARRDEALKIDAALTASGATADLVEMVERAGPFGAGNPEPVFALPAHVLIGLDAVGTEHLRARLKSADGRTLTAMAFRAVGKPLGDALLAARGRSVHAAGFLAVDRWQGQERVQMRLLDIAAA